ncbi:MAG: hypothetical protein K8L97_31040 [Anaerolineae bacterium]|nr:hypothetical protein [Anaerolineae bacterium]
MKVVDTSVFVAQADSRIKPEVVDLGNLPPIQKSPRPNPSPLPKTLIFQQGNPTSPSPSSSEAKQLLATGQPNNQITKTDGIRSALEAKALKPLTLRFPQELWDEIDEVMYYIKRRFKRKLTKNDLITLAVALLLKDFGERDLDSDLYKLLVLKQS